MKVSCQSCNSVLNIDDKKIPPGGARAKCPTCQNVFSVKPPAPTASPSSPVPLPGISAAQPQRQDWEEESTRVAELSMPAAAIPGATTISAPPTNAKVPALRAPSSSAVPLPGISAAAPQRQAWENESTRLGDVPLPGPARLADLGVSDRSAIPLPGSTMAQTAVAPAYIPQAAVPPSMRGSAIPPGVAPTPQSATAFAPTAVSPPLRGGGDAIPLPGAPSRTPPIEDLFGGGMAIDDSFALASIPLPGAANAASSSDDGSVPLPDADYDDGLVPLPGTSAPLEYGDGFDFSEAPAEPAAATPGGFDFDSAPPPPAAPGGFDFDSAPPPPAAPGGFDFDSAPPPPAAPGGFDFDSAPSPPAAPGGFDAAPAPGGFDFGPPPAAGGFEFDAPAAPSSSGVDFGSPPPPANQPPPTGFGEVDFGGGGGDLEFNPSAGAGAPEKKAPVADDLEADFSAPLPQSSEPAGPTDGLEMLSFIDKTAKEAGAQPEEMLSVRRFHVKRRSGKVFGPFEEAVVVKMLEDGQLLGNEEVSLDAVDWHAIGTEPALQAVIARLMEAPARTQTQTQLQQVGPSMDRLKQLYEGRMAAIAIVESKEPIPFKKKLPYIVLGVLVMTGLMGGVGLGVATPYGYFALKALFPAKVKPDTSEFGYLQVARKAFLQDTWKSYNLAKDSANQALQIKEYPEARAVWCQAVFYLSRKFGKADPAELEQAKAELVNVRMLGDKHPEVLKAQASEALSRNDADAALLAIADAVAGDGDYLESLFLQAEAHLQKRQPAQAKAEFEAVLKKDPKSAKALHGLGMLHKAQNELKEASGRLAEALEADPGHLDSAVELAEMIIVRNQEVERGNELLEKTLSEEGRSTLSPQTIGKALGLKGESLVVQGKLNEAVPLFEEALKADPQNAFTNARLAHTYAELNQPDKAAPMYAVAAKATPDSLEITEGFLSTLILLGRMDEATQVISAANTRFPGNATLSYLTARLADALGNSKDAEEAYKRAIAADPKIIDAYLFLSRNYMRDRRFKDAAPILEAGLAQAPDNAAMRVGMGELALHERNLERAENEFDKALELNPYSADAQLGASHVSQERGKFELAVTQVEKALELNPRIAGGRLQRGVALWKLQRLDEAITELEAAHEAAPKVTQIVVTLGAVKFDKGDLNGALSHLNSALIAEPGQPDANFYLAKLKNAKNEQTQAVEAMKRAVDANAKSPLYRYWYGRILADARKGDDALIELKLALEIDPKYADALEAIGKIYFDRNDFKLAVDFYQQELEIDPARVTVRALIGDAQIKLEDWSGAITSYTQALEADPDLKRAYSQLGHAYEEKKQYAKSVEWYTKAIEAEPDNADAWRALGYVNQELGKKKDAVTAFKKYLELRPEAEDKKEIGDLISYLEGK